MARRERLDKNSGEVEKTHETQMNQPLITVVTPTTGNKTLEQAIHSVQAQTYQNIQHLIVIDGQYPDAEQIVSRFQTVDVVRLPYPTGTNRFNGHRIYGASGFLAKGEYLAFLDEDNWFESNHIDSLYSVIQAGNTWAYSLRKIFDQSGKFICHDDCESLGKWPTVMSPEDFLIDVNCYLLPRQWALNTSYLWYRKFREPGQMEVDRVLLKALKLLELSFDCTFQYSTCYRTGNTQNSVTSNFFLKGNQQMLELYKGTLPWKKDKLRNV